jgi:hypothetical protein
MITIQRVACAADLTGWDDLHLGDGELPLHELYLSSTWLASYQAMGDWDPRYLLAFDTGLVGGLATHRIDDAVEGDPWRCLDFLGNMLPSRVVGGLTEGRTGPLTASGADRTVVIDRLLGEAEHLAHENAERSVVCRTVDAADTELRAVMNDRGYVETPGPNHMVLSVPRRGLEGYLASFDGRYRNMIRRELKKLRDANIAITVEPLTPHVINEVASLLANLNRRYGLKDDDGAVISLKLVHRRYKDDCYAVVARHCGRPVGFVDLVIYRGNAWCRQAGFDYDFQGTLPLYFGVLFYAVMDFAAKRRLATIDYTFGTEAAKQARGCTVHPTLRIAKLLT